MHVENPLPDDGAPGSAAREPDDREPGGGRNIRVAQQRPHGSDIGGGQKISPHTGKPFQCAGYSVCSAELPAADRVGGIAPLPLFRPNPSGQLIASSDLGMPR